MLFCWAALAHIGLYRFSEAIGIASLVAGEQMAQMAEQGLGIRQL